MEYFCSALLIEPSGNPKESIKNFFKISLGKDEGEIKKNWSDTLRKKIRQFPFIDFPEYDQMDYKDLKYLFNLVKVPSRSVSNGQFIIYIPFHVNSIKVINFNFWEGMEGLSACQEIIHTYPYDEISFKNSLKLVSLKEANLIKGTFSEFLEKIILDNKL